MSLDEQFEQMRYFAQALEEFNERLRVSVTDLTNKHDTISPLWQDSFRRKYDAEWNEFEERMKAYIQREAPAYAQFLDDKLKHLYAYLFGA
jgi:uncharacterized protein YukE